MKHLPVYLPLLLMLASCAPKHEETTTKGHLHILVAEDVAPVMAPEVVEFMRLYKDNGADVTYTVTTSKKANRLFLDDTARMIVTTVPLTEAEKLLVNRTTGELLEIVLAYEGVVGIVQDGNRMDELSLEEIRGVLDGTTTQWEQLHRTGTPRGKIRFILEDSSDVKNFLSLRLLGGRSLQVSPHWTSSALETISDVAKDRLSFGFVASSWVDSAKAQVRTLALAADSVLADTTFKPPVESIGKYYNAHPAYVYLSYYPMKRAIFLYARTTPGDFATGFASFVASPPGQRMFLQRGLVPGTQKIVLKPTE